MRLLIDSTSLQCVGQCLEGRAYEKIDVQGLLQLATLLVFADELIINEFVSEPVARSSQDTLSLLRELGVENAAFLTLRPSKESFIKAIERAANESATSIEFACLPNLSSGAGLVPLALSGNACRGLAQLLNNLSKSLDANNYLESVMQNAFSGDYVGSGDHMIAKSDSLREIVVRDFAKYHPDSVEIRHLHAFLRSQLYLELAKDANAHYTPAVARAKFYRATYRIIDSLVEKMDKVIANIKEVQLLVPSVQTALIKRSKSEPRALIEESLLLRARAKPVRNALTKLTNTLDLNTSDGRREAENQLRNHSAVLERSLRKSQSNWLHNALSVVFALCGSPSQILQSIDLLKDSLRVRRFAVLTDISRDALDPIDVGEDLAKLEKACGLGSE